MQSYADKMRQWMGRVVVMLALALVPTVSEALPIDLYVAPDNTYQNTTNSPCVFYGPGNCPQDPAGWPTPVGNTGGGNAFTPNPLTQSYSGAELIPFARYVGRDFLLVRLRGDGSRDSRTTPTSVRRTWRALRTAH